MLAVLNASAQERARTQTTTSAPTAPIKGAKTDTRMNDRSATLSEVRLGLLTWGAEVPQDSEETGQERQVRLGDAHVLIVAGYCWKGVGSQNVTRGERICRRPVSDTPKVSVESQPRWQTEPCSQLGVSLLRLRSPTQVALGPPCSARFELEEQEADK